MAAVKAKIKTIGIMSGGGDCPGINAVIRAVTKTAIHKHHLKVVGILDGFLGLIENRLQELGWGDVSNILTLGGTILGTSNKADPAAYPVRKKGKTKLTDVRDRCLNHAHRAGMDIIVVIGGDGTMACAQGLTQKGLNFIGVPKTIDNDLPGTDFTFGFDTAVATATEAIDKVHTTASSHHRVMIVEVMGRYAGWLALHAGLASGSDVILIPEIPYSLDAVCDYVRERSRYGKRFSIITVAEGAKPQGGKMTVMKEIKDSPDPIRLGGIANKLQYLIETKTHLDCRAVILGHVQRGGIPTAFDRDLASGLGYYAVELLMAGQKNKLVVYNQGQFSSIELARIAGQCRKVPTNHTLIEAARAMGTSFGD